MKTLIFLIGLIRVLLLIAGDQQQDTLTVDAVYYVAPDGNDANPASACSAGRRGSAAAGAAQRAVASRLSTSRSASNARVTGVRVIRRRTDSAKESLSADLIVDTTERGSRSPAWLEALGYDRPQEEAVKIGVTYISCLYERRPEHIPGVNALIVATTPENPRGGVLLSQEDNR